MTDVWAAADGVASEWARSPHSQVFREGLQTKPHDHSRPPFEVQSVQHLLVFYTSLKSQPLLLGLRVDHIPEFGELHRRSAEVRRWFDVASRFAYGFIEVIEFLRCRLPGYPTLLVPDLVQGAPRVYQNGFWDQAFPWMREIRQARLQFVAQPQLVKKALDLSDDAQALYLSLDVLQEALQASEAWKRFTAARAALQPADQEEAKRRRREYRHAVAEERLDDVAGDNGMRRQHMRRAELRRIKDDATGALREYYGAFDCVDELLNAVAALISHRIAEGDIDELPLIVADWGPDSQLRPIRMHATNDDMRHPYGLVKVTTDVPALSGLVLIHSHTFRLDEELLVGDGRLLSGSSDLPSRGPTPGPSRT